MLEDLENRWDFLFRKLKEAITRPTQKHPAAKVWKRSELTREISRIHRENREYLKTTFPSAKEVIARMEQIGWLLALETQPPSTGSPPQPLYLLDMEATPDETPDVLELLQGYESSGVLCYLAVLAHYELTTQIPEFAHIGILQDYEFPRATEPQSTPTTPEKPTQRNPIGTHLFFYQGTACYSTKRDRALVPGIQMRQMGPRTQLRMTTLEQTLLDTLFHPARCGGEALVFEAWERAIERYNPERLAKHLRSIDRDDFSRRVGAMFTLLDYEIPDGDLKTLLESISNQYRTKKGETEIISLLKGLTFPREVPEWGVTVP